MDEIQITLNGGDALALLPLIDEAAEAQLAPSIVRSGIQSDQGRP